jgi:hypothetical protein
MQPQKPHATKIIQESAGKNLPWLTIESEGKMAVESESSVFDLFI